MIYSLRGKLTHTEPSLCVIECGGVGYAFRTTLSTISHLRNNAEHDGDVFVYTCLQVREDDIQLFGFSTRGELSCFQMLISVTGVGPKAAIAILSDLSPERFALTVAASDSKTLTRTKGIGTKIAQRIVLELKDKLSAESKGVSGLEITAPMVDTGSGETGEAMSALQVLGYSAQEAAVALAPAPVGLPVEELVKLALKSLGKQRM